MASLKLAIHVPPDSNPETTSALIRSLAEAPSTHFASAKDMSTYLNDRGVSSRSEIRLIATSMGLLETTRSGLNLSPLGQTLSRLNDTILGEMFHYLMYTGWSESNPMEFLSSWSYRQCCVRYWHEGKTELTGDYLDRQVAEMVNTAPSVFANLGHFENVSFGRKSLVGVMKWLMPLQPSVLVGKTFKRRDFCIPELMLLALGYVLREEYATTNVDILLTREIREAICMLCLLELESFDRTLDWAMSVYPHLIEEGTTAGFYGRFVRLNALPTFENLQR